MSRAIIYDRPGGRGETRDASSALAPDDYAGRLLKLIPVEVIALYMTLVTIAEQDEDISDVVLWVLLLLGMGATYLYSRVRLRINDNRQLAVTVGAFFVWAMMMGGPFETDSATWYKDTYGAMILPIYTFLVPFIMRPK